MEGKRRSVKTLVSKLSSVSEQTRTEALFELRLISKHEPECRPLIADAGAVPFLADALFSSSPILLENATASLLNLSISSREALMSTRGLLDALSHTLRRPDSPHLAVQSAAATLHSLLVVEDYRPIIGAKRDIVYALVDLVKNPNTPSRSIKDALKALFGVSLYPLNRCTMIDLGAAAALFSLVVRDNRVGLSEDATAVIAQIAGCEEAKEAFRRVSGIGVLVDLLDPCLGSSRRTKENAVSALLNLVQCGGETQSDDVKSMALGVINGITDVAENGSSKGKTRAHALLKFLNRGWSSGNAYSESESSQFDSSYLDSSSYSAPPL